MIKKYIKRPIAVEAVQWRGSDCTDNQREWLFDCGSVRFGGIKPPKLLIYTLEGEMKARLGDYIVKGVDGEFYPVKKEIFEKTYVEVKDEDDEFISVRKDRLEDFIKSAYRESCSCLFMHIGNNRCDEILCHECKFECLLGINDIPVKNVIKWLDGE